ncbi:MAG: PepSY domain-containing protein [Lactobacillus sp.]|nr:PepSY domain-containing protein [Lactobacillus sp.]
MNEKIDKNQNQKNNGQQKKRPKLTKKLIITASVCGGLILGVGGTLGVMATHEHHEDAIAAVQRKKANKSDIKIDQQAAINKFNEKYKDKQINEVKLEPDHGQYVYKIKGFDNTNEYKVKVNAKNGKVISSKTEKLEKGDKKYSLDPSKAISRNEANTIAEKAAKKGSGVEWELKQETKNKSVWEVKVTDNNKTKEVNINATSKKVLNIDNDH